MSPFRLPFGPSLPVLTYHRVASGEAVEPEVFEAHLRALASSGLPSLGAGDLDSARRGYLVTFDDGFADLWTHGLPLLQARGVRAVVFAIASLAGEGPPRPQGVRAFDGGSVAALAEASRAEGPHPAFLRWSELAALEASGLVEVQSHSLSHRMGWCGEEIVRFHLGDRGKPAHWSLSQANGGDERLGVPVYPRRSALATRLYFDDPSLRDELAGFLARRGGAAYVDERGAEAVEQELWGLARTFREKNPSGGRWETAEERVARTLRDLTAARQLLESRLGGRRDELCLPWGHYDEVTLECARQAGVRRVYTTRHGPNPAGKAGFLVRRFGPRRGDGERWLRTRLWIYRSTLRGTLYAAVRGS